MKKKIIVGLALFTSVFFFGGLYLILTIENATSTLNNLIKLHQVEILREQLLIETKRVQTDLAFKNTRYARTLDTVIANVVTMNQEANKCQQCHHSPETLTRLQNLEIQIHEYQGALSRVLTVRANTDRLEAEEETAFMAGHKLVEQLNDMTTLTKARLEKRTQLTLRRISEMKIIIFALIFLGPVMAFGLAVIFIKGFTRPFRELLRATNIIKEGNLHHRVEGLQDEFGEMADSLHEMALSLHEQMQRMQRTEQMTKVGKIAAALVHEIKNPLAGIKGSLQLLQEEGGIPEENAIILSRTMEEVDRIEALMKSLLNFARPMDPLLMPVNVNDILESTLPFTLSYASMVSPKPSAIRIVKDYDPHLPPALADPTQMQQVFMNILMNAVEAMHEGGTLTVRTSANGADQGVSIDIADTGTGITSEIAEKIFEPFFTTKHKGTGLGLAVSRKYVEMQGGTISVKDNPEGGTIFRITLPVHQGKDVCV